MSEISDNSVKAENPEVLYEVNDGIATLQRNSPRVRCRLDNDFPTNSLCYCIAVHFE